MLILNVDDFEQARYAKTRLLRNAGFDVAEACNGQEALALTAGLLPALVLLDVRLPDLDGIEVCRRIKAVPALAAIRVVHISAALIAPADIARGFASGASGYIAAPYEPEELLATVRREMAWAQ